MAFTIKPRIGCDGWKIDTPSCGSQYIQGLTTNMPGFIGTYDPEEVLDEVQALPNEARRRGWTTQWSAKEQCVLWLCPDCTAFLKDKDIP